MTKKPYKTLSQEILKQVIISAIVSTILFFVLSIGTTTIIGTYSYDNHIAIDDLQWIHLENLIVIISLVLALIAFVILFILQFKEHIAYIHTLTTGIKNLQNNQEHSMVPLQGNNELTLLATTLNDVVTAQQQLRQKEKELTLEKENFIRSLGHDIRTPLTSILAYSNYLTTQSTLPIEEQKNYLELIQKKAQQIQDLTNLLLDGHKRNVQYFEDGKLLFMQIIEEFVEEIENTLQIQTNIHTCPLFSGHFDVQEIRRIFDNLASNILKYADTTQPVTLDITVNEHILCIKQSNAKKQLQTNDGYQIGLLSIQRLAQMYNGTIQIDNNDTNFTIIISLHL